MSEIFRLENVTKRFSNTLALKKLSLTLKKNCVSCIVGNNGAGKTTIIKIISNLINYDEGKVFAFDEIVSAKNYKYKNRLGIILSEPNYIEEFSVKRYWEFVGAFQNIDLMKSNDRINSLAEYLDLNDNLNTRISHLSDGNRMKVSIGASLIHNPDALIYDEPFRNLDINMTSKLTKLISEFRNTKTVIISSHRLELVVEISDYIYILENGQLLLEINMQEFGTMKEIKEYVNGYLLKDEQKYNLDFLK